MSKSLVINSSHYIVGSNNTFLYRFPNTVHFDVGSAIGVQSLSIYNSTFNIEQRRGNNTLQILWLGTTYNILIDDGYYSVSDINFKIQQFCILNNLYLLSNNGNNIIYYVELVTNSVRYSVQLNLYAIPSQAQATALGYTQPPNATWTFPVIQITPQLNVISQSFGNLIGFVFGTYPLTAQNTTQNFLSTLTPIISPINSYILTCNLLNSKYSIPNNTFYSIPINGSLGTLLSTNISTIVYNAINSQFYNEIVISFYDQYFNPLILHDFDLTLTLAIKESV